MRGLAVSLDGPPVGERDPWRAGALAVLDAARNVACAGGEPLGLTDCLNFGNPEKPEIAWELERAIEGIAEAAEALRIPVVSGNVSLYNEIGRARDPADAGRRLRRPRRRRPPGARRLAAGRRDPARRGAGRLRPRGGGGARRAALARARRDSRSRTTSPTAGSRSRSRRPRSGAAPGPTSTCRTSSRSAAPPILACAPADVSSLDGLLPLRRIGTAGGDKLLGRKLSELEEAHAT